jgi:hypothetical protein
MKTPLRDASARQHSGEPSSGLAANDAEKTDLEIGTWLSLIAKSPGWPVS